MNLFKAIGLSVLTLHLWATPVSPVLAQATSTTEVTSQATPLTGWYEARHIPTYQVVSLQKIGQEWYANLAELYTSLAFPVVNRKDWVPLSQFTQLTGLGYVQRIDHLFISQDGQFITHKAGGYTVLQTPLPDMDLREAYVLHPLEAEAMIIQAVNYHRFNHQLHSYERLQSLSLAAIDHSIAQRDRDQHSQQGFGGETHQERMELWTLTPNHRDYVRSSHVSRHEVSGAFTQAHANDIVDTLMTRSTGAWLMNGYYHHLGVGVGIQDDGTVRLTIHMATARHPHARHYHAQHVRGNREEAYARFNTAANAWFREHRRGQENPYR